MGELWFRFVLLPRAARDDLLLRGCTGSEEVFGGGLGVALFFMILDKDVPDNREYGNFNNNDQRKLQDKGQIACFEIVAEGHETEHRRKYEHAT